MVDFLAAPLESKVFEEVAFVWEVVTRCSVAAADLHIPVVAGLRPRSGRSELEGSSA